MIPTKYTYTHVSRKVFIQEPELETDHRRIKRRQTGFVHPEQFEELLRVRESTAKVLQNQEIGEEDSSTLPIGAPTKSTRY